jgi:hypothetical protein
MPERSKLNDSKALPESSASTTVEGGKLVGAAPGDLKRGYSLPGAPSPPDFTVMADDDGGFLGRPNGWER